VLARLLALALAALLVVRGLGLERGTLLALLLGALPLTLLPSYAVVAAAAVLRRRRLALLGCGLVVGHLLVLAPALGAAELPDGAEPAPRLRVVTANLYVLNPDPRRPAGRCATCGPTCWSSRSCPRTGWRAAGLRAARRPAALRRRARHP
jgi:hypothetical protein